MSTIRIDPSSLASASRFSVRLPDGNYRVRLRFSGYGAPGSVTVWAENRRLLTGRIALPPGGASLEILVNLRGPALAEPPPNAPGGKRVLLNDREAASPTWNDSLDLRLVGDADRLEAVELDRDDTAPTLFLAGDSTVADQGAFPYASWGQMLPRFLKPVVAVANHAESGQTLKSFIAELRLAKILETMKSGDYLFLQFGHNDQKAEWPQTYAASDSTFPAYLRVFIAEFRRRGGFPVLVTSCERRRFDASGRAGLSLGAYPDAVRRVAREEALPLIDLEAASRALSGALGAEGSAAAFVAGDATHHNNYGAYELAKAVAALTARAVPNLAPAVSAEALDFDPGRPDDPADLPEIAPPTVGAPAGTPPPVRKRPDGGSRPARAG
jgi:lysophospholipase L1-like esterase